MAFEGIISLMQENPRASILLLAAAISLFISIVQFFVVDKEKMRELKARQKRINEDMKIHANDSQKRKELMGELSSSVMETFKHSFKPMIITLIPVILVFSFMKGVYAETIIAKSWIWYYLGGAIVASLIFRKLFRLP